MKHLDPVALLTALGGLLGTTLGAVALVIKAMGGGAARKYLLARWLDWTEASAPKPPPPSRLLEDTRDELKRPGDEPSTPSKS